MCGVEESEEKGKEDVLGGEGGCVGRGRCVGRAKEDVLGREGGKEVRKGTLNFK